MIIRRAIILSTILFSSLVARELSHVHGGVIAEHKSVIEKLILVAQTQQEIMQKLLSNKNTTVEELKKLSLNEIDQVLKALEDEENILEDTAEGLVPGSAAHSKITTKYLPLLLELRRRLQCARLEYHKRVKTTKIPSRALISLGVGSGIGVAVYLLGMYYSDLKLGLFDALKYALIAGSITAVVLYREEVVNGVKTCVDVCVATGKKALESTQGMSSGTKIALVTGAGVLVGAPLALRVLPKMLGFSGGNGKKEISAYLPQANGCFQLNDPNA